MKTDRAILERAIAAVAAQARETDVLVHEALELGLGGSSALVVHAKMIRQELLRTKADLERHPPALPQDLRRGGRAPAPDPWRVTAASWLAGSER